VRDKDKNIIKSYCYNYAGEANGCYISQQSFSNNQQSGAFTRSCGSSSTGSTVPYYVNAGTYTSNISQQDADNQAISDVQANGQNYANSTGTCTVNASFTLTN